MAMLSAQHKELNSKLTTLGSLKTTVLANNTVTKDINYQRKNKDLGFI